MPAEHLSELEAVGRIQRLFLAGLDVSDLRAAVVETAVELTGATGGALFEESAEGRVLAVRIGDGAPTHEIRLTGRTGNPGILALAGLPETAGSPGERFRVFFPCAAILLLGARSVAAQANLRRELSDSEELHRIVAETGYEYSYVATIQDGRISFYSPRPEAAAEIAGVEPGGDLAAWGELVDPRDRDAVHASIGELMERGVTRLQFRFRRPGPDGRTRWVEKVERLMPGPGGVMRVYGAIRDITAEKEATERLREREQELRAILESEPECVKTLDRDARLLHMNPAGLAMIEAESLEQVRGLSVFDLIAPEHRPVFADLHGRVLAGESVTQEFEIIGLRGTRRWMETHAVPLRDAEGAVVSHLAITRDVTQRRRVQEETIAAQRREALGVMAAGIAHDFNNMLYVILGRVDLALRKVEAGSALAHDLAEIREAARRAAAVARQILTFSRGSAGEDAPVDLDQTVAQAIAMLRVSLPEGIEIHTLRDGNGHGVLGDPSQLLQIVVNLATNAADAMRDRPRREIEVGLETVAVGSGDARLPRGDWVRLRVRDTGAGMPPHVRQRALEPYFTTKPPNEGSGLGLAVVDGIVRRLGGAVRIESEPGVGTSVEVWLPAREAGEALAAEPRARTARTAPLRGLSAS